MRHLCASAAVVVLILGVLSPPLSLGQTPGTLPGVVHHSIWELAHVLLCSVMAA